MIDKRFFPIIVRFIRFVKCKNWPSTMLRATNPFCSIYHIGSIIHAVALYEIFSITPVFFRIVSRSNAYYTISFYPVARTSQYRTYMNEYTYVYRWTARYRTRVARVGRIGCTRWGVGDGRRRHKYCCSPSARPNGRCRFKHGQPPWSGR